MNTTLMIKEVTTLPLTVDVCIPPDTGSVLKGKFKAHAVIRTKDQLKALGERMASGEFTDNDEKLLREMYTKFEGLGDAKGPFNEEQGWEWILTGPFSGQISLLLLNRYYEGHSEARQGNSGRPR